MVPRHAARLRSPVPDDAPPRPPAGRRWDGRSYIDAQIGLPRLLGRFSGAGGVVLVEFALVLPLILFMMLAAAEMGLLFAFHADQDRRTGALAEWAAEHPDSTDAEWSALVVTIGPCASAERSETDDMVTVGMTCTYSPAITANLWEGLPVSTQSVAAIRGEVAGATGSPSASVAP